MRKYIVSVMGIIEGVEIQYVFTFSSLRDARDKQKTEIEYYKKIIDPTKETIPYRRNTLWGIYNNEEWVEIDIDIID